MEKANTFACGRGSVLADCDVGMSALDMLESVFGTFDWLRTILRRCCLINRAYELLFSISATMKSIV